MVLLLIVGGISFLAFKTYRARLIYARAQKSSAKKVVEYKTPVTVLCVYPSNWENWVNLYGTLESAYVYKLSSLRMLKVKGLYVKEGDVVKKGQLLLSLKSVEIKTDIQALRARVNELEKRYDRLKRLYKAGGVSLSELESAKVSYQQARAQLLKALETSYETSLKSPADGVVLNVFTNVGEIAQPGRTLIEVADIKKVKLKIVVPEYIWNKIKTEEFQVIVYGKFAGSYKKAISVKALPIVDKITDLPCAEALFENINVFIPFGTTVEVKLLLNKLSDAMVLPFDVVLWDLDGKPYVFIVDPQNGKAYKRYIKILEVASGKCLVKGIKSKDLVVESGATYLYDGAVVKIISKREYKN